MLHNGVFLLVSMIIVATTSSLPLQDDEENFQMVILCIRIS